MDLNPPNGGECVRNGQREGAHCCTARKTQEDRMNVPFVRENDGEGVKNGGVQGKFGVAGCAVGVVEVVQHAGAAAREDVDEE